MIRNRFLILCLALTGLVFCSFLTYRGVVNYTLRQVGPAVETQYFFIKPGAGLSQVAHAAKQAALVPEAWHLSFAARHLGVARSLKAGEYEVPQGTSVRDLLALLSEGKTYLRRISIPEGYSVLELEQLLQESFGLDLNNLLLPAEGSILPETYFYSRGETANAVIDRMKQSMSVVLEKAWKKYGDRSILESKNEVLVLASIVEKETAVPEERAQVAAVFLNRLKRNMRLQSDPTVVYGITGGLPLGRALTRSDLRAETSYNTYRVKGLPPTPITNPGRASIEAVLNPANVSYLYFVANGKGGHAFANTLAEHNRNVRAWRTIKAQSKQ